MNINKRQVLTFFLITGFMSIILTGCSRCVIERDVIDYLVCEAQILDLKIDQGADLCAWKLHIVIKSQNNFAQNLKNRLSLKELDKRIVLLSSNLEKDTSSEINKIYDANQSDCIQLFLKKSPFIINVNNRNFNIHEYNAIVGSDYIHIYVFISYVSKGTVKNATNTGMNRQDR